MKDGRKDEAPVEDDDSDLDLPEGEPISDQSEAEEAIGTDEEEGMASTSQQGKLKF